jgi:peptidoglycan/xylan/chitin deacetylase (PgdA/CDA1 family)
MLKHKKLLIVLGIFILTGIFFLNFIQKKYVVPILMYHSVNPNAHPKNRLVVSANSFKRQMHFLKSCHYNVIPLESVARLIKDRKKLPPKTVAITFDDGYKDVYVYAFPILRKYNLPATIFIIVNEIGRPQQDRLNWDEIDKMQESGIIDFGSHCLGPEPLVNIKSEGIIREEIFDSKRALEARLGSPILAFSYPEGKFNDKIRQLVIGAGYRVAVTTKPGKSFPNDDIFALKRLRISSTSDNLFVFWFETTGFYSFIREAWHK